MKKPAFQIAAVVGIVGVACVLYNVVPRWNRPAVSLPLLVPRPGSEFFQANHLAHWNPPNGPNAIGHKKLPQPDGAAIPSAEAFLAVSGWGAQPQFPLPLGPVSTIGTQTDRDTARAVKMVDLLHLALLEPATWDRVGVAAAVGSGGGPGGPFSAVASLMAEPELHRIAVNENVGGAIVVWGSRTTNFSFENGTNRKTYTDRFSARPAEAETALRALRERLEAKARQLGAELHDPAETVRDERLTGFAFVYTLESARGRVAAAVEPGLSDYQLRLEVEEKAE